MTTIQQTYLQLLRQAIYSVDGSQCIVHDEDIEALMRLVQIQGTTPLIFNELLSLPSRGSVSPDETGENNSRKGEIIGALRMVCMQNMVAQEEMKAVMQKTLTALEAGNVHAVVFKGFALAQLYPNPYLRQWGDIDIYVGTNGYHLAADILRKTWPECPCFESEEDFFKHWNIK